MEVKGELKNGQSTDANNRGCNTSDHFRRSRRMGYGDGAQRESPPVEQHRDDVADDW